MFHEPCGFVLDFQRAVELVSADPFLAGPHQMRGLEPFVQRNMAALENRPDRNGKFALAGAAAPQASATTLYHRNPIKAATARAIGTLRPYNRFEASDGSGFAVEMGLRENGHRHGLTP